MFYFERPFKCSIEDCPASYRKDHLARHFLQHKGKIFSCPVDGCNRHEDSHGNSLNYEVKLEILEAFCCECMKYFSNVDYPKEHMQSAHQLVNCDICGTKQLRKNIQWHLRTHEKKDSADSGAFRCDAEHCLFVFSTKSNLRQHVKAVHLEVRPFVCSYKDCGKKFAYKHMRDHHKKTGCHVYTPGDFEESDEQFRSRPRGGRKRKFRRSRSSLEESFVSVTIVTAANLMYEPSNGYRLESGPRSRLGDPKPWTRSGPMDAQGRALRAGSSVSKGSAATLSPRLVP
ncbi:hypothetical protein NL676_018648 [Syzygium grande]|nr:hypothetical protein NL676_018648 [Syzygium grande]